MISTMMLLVMTTHMPSTPNIETRVSENCRVIHHELMIKEIKIEKIPAKCNYIFDESGKLKKSYVNQN